jgi:hypothetical protein
MILLLSKLDDELAILRRDRLRVVPFKISGALGGMTLVLMWRQIAKPYPVIKVNGFPEWIITLSIFLSGVHRDGKEAFAHRIEGAPVRLKLVTEHKLHAFPIYRRGFVVCGLRGVLVDQGKDAFHHLPSGIDAAEIETAVVRH